MKIFLIGCKFIKKIPLSMHPAPCPLLFPPSPVPDHMAEREDTIWLLRSENAFIYLFNFLNCIESFRI
jgi:hypothetical protein